ncbi:acyl-CoA thioester hydrolase [Nakamurella panacisegetis]|uniref:Acyl-CoA thioester hydrolase n=1 Tax=Nakamurella panacisegetis TaxID=1090615 RepID=A0A1H0T662_9ACTN|nr:acyl-CoA thioester hydrolase [Nakamurella panacisegetis]
MAVHGAVGQRESGRDARTVHKNQPGRRYVTDVRVRWSDLDAYGHVNNARALTLLEEARVDWLFTEATRRGAAALTGGMVVSRMSVHYKRSITFGEQVKVSMGVVELKSVSTTIDYVVTVDDQVSITATTQLVPVDPVNWRPRRWDSAERAFLTEYLAG